MAKAAAKPKKEVSMEEALWKSADKLRGSVEPASTSTLFSAFSSLNLRVINLKRRERLSLRNLAKSSSTMLLSIQRTMFSSFPKIAVGLISLNTQSKMILLLK